MVSSEYETGGLQIWSGYFGEEKIMFISQSTPSVEIKLMPLLYPCYVVWMLLIPWSTGLQNSCSSSQEISTFNRSQRFIILFFKSGSKIEGSKVVCSTLKANGDKRYSSTHPQLF